MTGLRVAVASSIAEIEAEPWDALVGEDGFYSSHGALSAVEAEPGACARYVLVSAGSRLVAGLPVYVVAHDLNSGYDPARRGDALAFDGPVAVAGPRRGYRNVLAVDRSAPPELRRAALRAAVEHALALAAAAGRTALVWPFASTETLRRLSEAVPTRAAFETGEAEIAVAGSTLEDHLAQLPRSRRKQAKSDLRAFRGAGWDVREERLLRIVDEAAPLLANVERKYGRMATVPGLVRHLRTQATSLDGRDVVFTCRDARGTLAGYFLAYRWRDTLYGRLNGFDYDRLRGGREYFALSFYAPLAYAAGHSLRCLHLGIGALEAKVMRGARLLPLWAAAVSASGPGSLVLAESGACDEFRSRFERFTGAIRDGDWRLPRPAYAR